MKLKGPPIHEGIFIHLPSLQSRIEALKYYCKEHKFKGEVNFEEIGEKTKGSSISNIWTLIGDAIYSPVRRYYEDNKDNF